jgi:hypothetical protein
MYMGQYLYSHGARQKRKQRVRRNRRRRYEKQYMPECRAQYRLVTIHHNLVVLRMRGFVLPETR